jgi:predicted transcriptional regulator of viral defense system
MEYRSTKTALRKLWALAQGQGGYFTAKQAAEIGYSYPHLDYHVGTGNFERAGHGVYRLPEIPLSEHDDLVKLSFWSRDRDDHLQAIASHDTALAVHGLSDLLPSKIHLTVPLKFRKTAPDNTVLHRGVVEPADIELRAGFNLTNPLRTLVDIAADERISEEHLRKAVAEALDRGVVRRSQLAPRANALPAASRLSRLLAAVS